MTKRTQLGPVDLPIGEPLSLDVYDDTGRLLLRQGNVIGSQAQLDRSLDRSVYGEIDSAGDPNDTLAISEGTGSSNRHVEPESVFPVLRAAREGLDAALYSQGDEFLTQILDSLAP